MPDGTLDCPLLFQPQQLATPPVSTAHVCHTPAEMAADVLQVISGPHITEATRQELSTACEKTISPRINGSTFSSAAKVFSN